MFLFFFFFFFILNVLFIFFFFFQAEDGIRDVAVTGVQTCALPICHCAPSKCPLCRGAPTLPGPLRSARLFTRDVVVESPRTVLGRAQARDVSGFTAHPCPSHRRRPRLGGTPAVLRAIA